MWFDLNKISPDKFRDECIKNNSWCDLKDPSLLLSWDETFKLMGFNSYKEDYGYNNKCYMWLDDNEFTMFVLRFGE